MPATSIYRCSQCGNTYKVREAGLRNWRCCKTPLIREEAARPLPLPKLSLPKAVPAIPSTAPSNLVLPDSKTFAATGPLTWPLEETELMEIIPGRENLKDAQAIEGLIGSFHSLGLMSLGIGANSDGVQFYYRSHKSTMPHLLHQTQSTYDQVEVKPIPIDQDPARPSDVATTTISTAVLTYRRGAYLPIRTYLDGEMAIADPIQTLLGSFSGFEPGERAVSEIVLTPAPAKWADQTVGSKHQLQTRYAPDGTAGSADKSWQHNLAGGAFVGFLMLIACGLLEMVNQNWLMLGVVITLALFEVVVVVVVAVLLQGRGNVDPEMVGQKMKSHAFDVSIRLMAVGLTPERALARLNDMAHAYQAYDLANGNSLVPQPAAFNPQILETPRWTQWQMRMQKITRMNISEVASLWHLPVGTGTQMVSRSMAKRMLPAKASLVGQGILIGHSRHHDQQIPVHLSTEMLFRHTFLIAKTQQGKSTMMAHLTRAALNQNAAVVVIDPHTDLVQKITTLVPRPRSADVVLMDFANAAQVVGFNLIDVSQGHSIDGIVSNLVHVGSLVWSNFWGPRMEDCFRHGLLTLLYANETRISLGRPQFTILDFAPLFENEGTRHSILDSYVKDRYVHSWWRDFWEPKTSQQQTEMVTPVLTKLHRFASNKTIRNIVGQSESTVNFRDIVAERKILLVNTASNLLGDDAGGLLGAVIVDHVNFAVREQIALDDRTQRNKVVVVIDEFQTIPGVDYPALLGELQKMGASFILATQGLDELNKDKEHKLLGPIMSNISTLVVFQTSAEDADYLRHELDEAVEVPDISNLPGHACYLKTSLGRDRLPVVYVETLPPPAGDAEVGAEIHKMLVRYTRPAIAVENERAAFEEVEYAQNGAGQHHTAEANQYRAQIAQNRVNLSRPNRTKGVKRSQDAGEATDANAKLPGTIVPRKKPVSPGSVPDEERYKEKYVIPGGGPTRLTDVDPNAEDPLTAKDTLVVNGHPKKGTSDTSASEPEGAVSPAPTPAKTGPNSPSSPKSPGVPSLADLRVVRPYDRRPARTLDDEKEGE